VRGRPGHPESGIPEHAGKRGESPQRQARRRNEGMGIKATAERDIHEEALWRALCFGESPVLQIRAHDARVVSSVPGTRGRSRDELQPEPHGLRRRLSGETARERDHFASILQQSLIDRPPPLAARGDASSGLSTPRCACQRMNETAARRNGR
jgi:hypothetical protein